MTIVPQALRRDLLVFNGFQLVAAVQTYVATFAVIALATASARALANVRRSSGGWLPPEAVLLRPSQPRATPLASAVDRVRVGQRVHADGFHVGGEQSANTLLWIRVFDVAIPVVTSLLAIGLIRRVRHLRAEGARHTRGARSAAGDGLEAGHGGSALLPLGVWLAGDAGQRPAVPGAYLGYGLPCWARCSMCACPPSPSRRSLTVRTKPIIVHR